MLQPFLVNQAEVDIATTLPTPQARWDLDQLNDYPDTTDLERLFTTLRDDELLSLERSLSKGPSKEDETPLLLPEFVDPSSLSTLSVIPGEHPRASGNLNSRTLFETEPLDTRALDLSIQHDPPVHTSKKGLVLYVFYSFIGVDVLNLSSSDKASSLEDEGCFHLPSKTIMDEFMKQYFLYVHPFIPLIDEGDFWNVYQSQENANSTTRGDYSLFVIQAMLFMSCPVSLSPRAPKPEDFFQV